MSPELDSGSTPRHAVPPAASAIASPRFTSEQLLSSSGQAVIVHQGREYRLRLTQNGKLILTA
jgi:hemin uptake protein HemP